MEQGQVQAPIIRPHMSAGEIALFDQALERAGVYLEFGSGGTTLAAAMRPGLRCFSVEADKKWIARLMQRAEIRAAAAEKRLQLIHADIGEIGQWSLPVDPSADLAWENYCLGVWTLLPSAPDLVLVDGRFRLACCILSLLACPPGTRILLHDFGLKKRNRRNYGLVTQLAEITQSCDSLVMLQHKTDFDPLKAVALLDKARQDHW